MTNAFYHV